MRLRTVKAKQSNPEPDRMGIIAAFMSPRRTIQCYSKFYAPYKNAFYSIET